MILNIFIYLVTIVLDSLIIILELPCITKILLVTYDIY